MIGHVAGAPVEELLPLLGGIGGIGAASLLARAWVASRLRRPVQQRSARSAEAPGPPG